MLLEEYVQVIQSEFPSFNKDVFEFSCRVQSTLLELTTDVFTYRIKQAYFALQANC